MTLTYFMAAITVAIAASIPPLVFAADTFQSTGLDWLAHICAGAIRLSRRLQRRVNQGVAAALARRARELAHSAPGRPGNCERDGIRIYRVSVANDHAGD
jgi:hypothetical protein